MGSLDKTTRVGITVSAFLACITAGLLVVLCVLALRLLVALEQEEESIAFNETKL